MTVRRFVMWYLGTVLFVTATGASSYQALQRLRAANNAAPTPAMSVAQADTPPQAPAQPILAPSLPKLRPPLPMASKPGAPERKRVVAAHTPPRHSTTTASVHRPPRVDGPWGYPPPPAYGYYGYPARYPYPAYDPYYPRYGYYRTF